MEAASDQIGIWGPPAEPEEPQTRPGEAWRACAGKSSAFPTLVAAWKKPQVLADVARPTEKPRNLSRWSRTPTCPRCHPNGVTKMLPKPLPALPAQSRSTCRNHVRPLIMPKVGLEPTRPLGHKILSLARLPFRHFGLIDYPNRAGVSVKGGFR